MGAANGLTASITDWTPAKATCKGLALPNTESSATKDVYKSDTCELTVWKGLDAATDHQCLKVTVSDGAVVLSNALLATGKNFLLRMIGWTRKRKKVYLL